MTDNRHTQEAAEIRDRSEYLKTVEDFARYMEKEYIDGDDRRSLLISAGDRNTDGLPGGMAHIMLGDSTMNTAALASMMKQEGFRDVLRTARVVSAAADQDMDEVIRDKRRRLRVDYGIASLLGVWTLCLAAMGVAGLMHWAFTLTNLLLMAFTWLNLWREIRPLRRQVTRLEAGRREDREARRRSREEAVDSFLSELRRSLGCDGKDD